VKTVVVAEDHGRYYWIATSHCWIACLEIRGCLEVGKLGNADGK